MHECTTVTVPRGDVVFFLDFVNVITKTETEQAQPSRRNLEAHSPVRLEAQRPDGLRTQDPQHALPAREVFCGFFQVLLCSAIRQVPLRSDRRPEVLFVRIASYSIAHIPINLLALRNFTKDHLIAYHHGGRSELFRCLPTAVEVVFSV